MKCDFLRTRNCGSIALFLIGMATVGCSVSACSDKAVGYTIPANWPRPKFETDKASVDGHEVTIEIADTTVLRRYGYMFVSPGPNDEQGMLFIYPAPMDLTFWMRNTRVPLDLLFLDEEGTIVNIHREMVPGKEDGDYRALKKCRFALELRGGWCDRYHVFAGKKVEIPEAVRRRPAEENLRLEDTSDGNIPSFPVEPGH